MSRRGSFHSRSSSSSRVSLRIDNLSAPNKCTYRAIELPNEAFACLTNHSSSPLSQIIVSLGVGRLNDPPNCRGLADLCQCLTLPEDAATIWPDCVAVVRDDLTVYKFRLDTSRVPNVLERLGAGMQNPRFSEPDIKKELEAGHYKRNLPALDWLQRASGNPDHQFNRSAHGNELSVSSIDATELLYCLVEFHAKYYSGNILRLAIEDSRSLDSIEEIVATTFGDLPNRSVERLKFDSHPLEVSNDFGGDKVRGRKINIGGMYMMFPLPDQTGEFRFSPDLYVKHLMLSNHSCGLKSCLSHSGIHLINAGLIDLGNSGFETFCVSAKCKSGVKYSVEVENTFITAVLRYLAMLRHVGPQVWMHNEVRLIRRTEYSPQIINDVPLPSSPLSDCCDEFSVASRLQRYRLRDVLSARHILNDCSTQAISDLLKRLTPQRCRVYVSDFDWIDQHLCTYQSPDSVLCCQPNIAESFVVEKLPKDLLAACSAPWPSEASTIDFEFQLPRPKQFVCTVFGLRPRATIEQPWGLRQLSLPPNKVKYPNSPNVQLWFRQDELFNSEVGYVSVDLLLLDKIQIDALFLLDILAVVFSNGLQSVIKAAAQVGLELSVARSCSGIQVCCKGHMEPLPKLLTVALHTIVNIEVTAESFEKARTSLVNKALVPTDVQDEVFRLASRLNLTGFLHFPMLAEAADYNGFQVTDLEAITSAFQSGKDNDPNCSSASDQSGLQKNRPQQPMQNFTTVQVYFADILVFGNAASEDAVRIADIVLDLIPSLMGKDDSVYLNIYRRKEHLLSEGIHSTVQLEGSESGTQSHCALVVQIPTASRVPWINAFKVKKFKYSFRARASHDCLLQLLLEATKDLALDGITGGRRITWQKTRGYSGNSVTFQLTGDESPIKMEFEIETFIAELGKYLANLTQEKLCVYKERTLASMKESVLPGGIEENYIMYWTRLTCSDFNFDWAHSEVPDCYAFVVENITITDVVNYWKTWFQEESEQRRILSLHNFKRTEPRSSEGSTDRLATKLGKLSRDLETILIPSTKCLSMIFDA